MVHAQPRICPGEWVAETSEILRYKQITQYRPNNQPDLMTTTTTTTTKGTCRIVDFAVPADLRVKLKESEKKDKYLDLARELTKNVKYESVGYSSYNWWSWYCHQMIVTGIGGLRNNRTRGVYPNYSIVKIGQNTTKSPGDLRRFAVTQTPVKDPSICLSFQFFSFSFCGPLKQRNPSRWQVLFSSYLTQVLVFRLR